MSILGFMRTLLFSLFLAAFLVDSTREFECAFSDFAEESDQFQSEECNLQTSSSPIQIGGVRFYHTLHTETRTFSRNFIDFEAWFVNSYSFFNGKQKFSAHFPYYSQTLLWVKNTPKYILLRQIIV